MARAFTLFLASLVLALAPSLPALAGTQEQGAHELQVSPATTLATGSWRYQLSRDDSPVACRYQGAAECVTYLLHVQNDSHETLECESSLAYHGVNNEGVAVVRSARVVLPNRRLRVMRDLAKPDPTAPAVTVSCKVRPPRVATPVTPECKYKILATPDIESYYPSASRRLAEEGSVDMAFVLEAPEGHATSIEVVGSSLSTRLDAAAIAYLQAITFSTPCPSTHYTLRVSFALGD